MDKTANISYRILYQRRELNLGSSKHEEVPSIDPGHAIILCIKSTSESVASSSRYNREILASAYLEFKVTHTLQRFGAKTDESSEA
jgi:hypothetical protein